MGNNKIITLSTNNDRALPAATTKAAIVQIRAGETPYQRYRNIPRGPRQEWLATEFRKYMALARVKDVNPNDIVAGAVALDEMILAEPGLADLTQPEISQAFKNGVFGKYGEYFGLTAMSFYGFLGSYLESDEKQEATLEIRKRIEAERARSEEDRRRREKEKILAEIAEAKRNGFVPTWGPGHNFSPKKVSDILDSSEHRERVRRQAMEILSAGGQK